MAKHYKNPTAGAAQEALTAGAAGPVEVEAAALVALIPQAAVADVAGTTPAGGTGATAGAYDTAAHRDALIATVAELKTQLNSLLAKLRTAGIVSP
jgi:hypothetical protein